MLRCASLLLKVSPTWLFQSYAIFASPSLLLPFFSALDLSHCCSCSAARTRRREAEAVQDRDVRLADLQAKIGDLSQAKERAVKDGGSEVASLEVKIVGFIKDNSELLRANK